MAGENRLDTSMSEDQITALQSYLLDKFENYRSAREPIDNDIVKEVEAYNGLDGDVEKKQEYEHKIKEPIIYTMVQTVVARLISTIFPVKNYLKMYVEKKDYKQYEKPLTDWMQYELDKLKFKGRARDIFEEALKSRLSWLHLRPVPIKSKTISGEDITGYKAEFDIFKVDEVWFDTRAKTVQQSDFFVKKIKKLWQVKSNIENYFNIDKIVASSGGGGADENNTKTKYEATHTSLGNNSDTPRQVEPSQGLKSSDEIELLEFYGVYDFSDKEISDPDWVPDPIEVICTIANRATLIRVERNTLKTARKRLMFPIRPIRQANTIMGKGLPQLTIGMQQTYNEILSLQMDNFVNQIKLTWKINRNGGIDPRDVFAGDGNVIEYDEDPNDIQTITQPDLTGMAGGMAGQKMRSMQTVTGASDPIMGQTGTGAPETAAEIKTVTEQSLFKFSMMADNCYDDIVEFVQYVMILLVTYNNKATFVRFPELDQFLLIPPEELEESLIVDIALKDLSQRRDVEQNQWANMAGMIAPILQQSGGNMFLFFKNLFDVFQVPNAEEILSPESPDQIVAKLMSNPQLMQTVMTQIQQLNQGGGAPAGGAPNAGQTPAVPNQVSVEKRMEGQQ